MINGNIIQISITILLAIYLLGAMYFMTVITTYMIRRERNHKISLLVDVLARILTVLDVTLFWPIHLFTN